jgi:hypothetical protein
MATETSVQTIREAPYLEEARLALLKSAEALVGPRTDLAGNPLLDEKGEPLPTIEVPAYEVAGLGTGQIQAADLAESGVGAYQPYLTEAEKGMVAGQTLTGQAAQGIAGLDISAPLAAAYGAYQSGAGVAGDIGTLATTAGQGLPTAAYGASMIPGATTGYQPSQALAYMNPYQQQVTANALKEMQRQADIAAQGQAAQAVRAGAFGGTREGVQRAELGRGLMDVMGQRILQDYSQNYQQAQQAAQQGFEAQQQRQLAGGQALGQMSLLPSQIAGQQANILGGQANVYGQLAQGIGGLGMQQGQFGLQQGAALSAAGQQLSQQAAQRGQLGALQQQLSQADIGLLSQVGAQEQALQQAKLDALRATKTQEAFLPYQLLSFQSDILAKTPGSQTSITSATAPSPSPLVTALSTGIAGLATATGAKRAGLF